MLTDRDKLIISTVDKFGIATASQIFALANFPSPRRCQQRLKILVDTGYLARTRTSLNLEYLYYINKAPQQLEHYVYRLDFHIVAKQIFQVNKFEIEYTEENLRADAFCEIQHEGYIFRMFVEVQLHNKFDQQKYETLYNSFSWTDKWKSFPRIIIITDKHIELQPTKLKYIIVKTDMEGIEKICNLEV